METLTTEILVIGGGPGGTPLAMATASAGRQVVLVEAGSGLGGTCLFHGCVPSKIFREAAFFKYRAEKSATLGIQDLSGKVKLDWNAVLKRKESILSARSTAALANGNKISSLKIRFGTARFLNAQKAIVEGPQGSIKIEFEKAVIATGSVSRKLDVPGAQLSGVLTSEQLIATDHIPRSIVVIGGGPIGVELGQMFSMMGSRVSILEALPELLASVDQKLSSRLKILMEREGITVRTGVQIERIEEHQGLKRVFYSEAGKECFEEAEVVLTVVGRSPQVDSLGLENTQVRYASRGIEVDESLRTAEKNIWAVGDVTGQPMFAHWATAQAQALASAFLGRPTTFPRKELNSAVIFSHPEIGIVGLTEDAARKQGLDVGVAEYNYAVDARAQIADEPEGLLRIVYRRDDLTVIGVHALVEGAADLMGEAALAVSTKVKLSDLARTIHPHPTLTESFGVNALGALRTLT
ncbi:MAG: NAD(P)/FAD-dependent oxidoreductase [Spirochaetales bacterium]|nr:NAD(P)/FAD-dependent oxidoreductase [Spirochaetales bacterium]